MYTLRKEARKGFFGGSVYEIIIMAKYYAHALYDTQYV